MDAKEHKGEQLLKLVYSFAASASAVVIASAPVTAQTLADQSRMFGAREDVEQASLSPDGTKFAFIAPTAGQGSAIMISDLTGDSTPRRIMSLSGDPDRLSGCRWAANDRLLCNVYAATQTAAGLSYVSRMFAVDSSGANMKVIEPRGSGLNSLRMALWGGGVIDWLPDQDGKVLITRDYVPEQSTGTLLAQTQNGLGVEEFDTRTLKSKKVERPSDDVSEFITDGRGNVRIMGKRIVSRSDNTDLGRTDYSFRAKGSRSWKPLSSFDQRSETGFNPYFVDSDLDVAFGIKEVNGFKVAFTKRLDGSGTETLLFSAPGVDVDGFARIGRRGRVVGVTYSTDRPMVKYTDPALERVALSLSRAIPNLPLIRFVDSTADESQLLIWAGSDRDPGRYFRYRRAEKKLEELLPSRAMVQTDSLAAVKAITYTAADGTTIPAYLTLPVGGTGKQIPAIVMPHGGPGARDEWGFDWLSQFYAARGFAVIQPNFRGSAGYGDSWFQKNGFQSWPTAIGDVRDAGAYLVKAGIADPQKLAIVGWSYGGYAALQAAATSPDMFKAVVAIAPVTDLDRLRAQYSNWSNFELASDFIGKGAHVETGSPARHAAKIKAPVMMFHGAMDSNVDIGHSRLMSDRLKSAGKSVELITYNKLDHYLEDGGARADMLSKTDSFLRTSLKIAN